MAVVYMGVHPRLSIPVAVKLLNPGHEDCFTRLLHEARLAAKIDHPNVVRVYDVNSEGSLLFMIQEYVQGETVLDLIRTNSGTLSEVRALEICADVARGLAAIHALQFLHRDIKPENILVRARDGVAKLADMGVAARFQVDDPLKSVEWGNALEGTPGYISPEHIDGTQISPASDIYSLGVVLFELLTGQSAFGNGPILTTLRQQTQCEFLDPQTLRPDISSATGQLVKRCTSLNPKGRMSGSELLDGLLDARLNLRSDGAVRRPSLAQVVSPIEAISVCE